MRNSARWSASAIPPGFACDDPGHGPLAGVCIHATVDMSAEMRNCIMQVVWRISDV